MTSCSPDASRPGWRFRGWAAEEEGGGRRRDILLEGEAEEGKGEGEGERRRRGEEPGSTRSALRKSALDTCAPAIQESQGQDNQRQS